MYKINTYNISGVGELGRNSDWRVVMNNYVCMYQRSAWVWASQQYWNSITLIHSYSLQHWFLSTGCNKYEYEAITFEICFIQFHKFRKILLILINDSSDSNHSSKFAVLVVVAFTKKKSKEKKTKIASKANTQSASEYCSVGINNIVRIVKYEYDEYFKLWIWVLWV